MLPTCPSQRLLKQESNVVLTYMQAPEPVAEAGSAAQTHSAAAEPAPPSASEPASAAVPAADAAPAEHAPEVAGPEEAAQPGAAAAAAPAEQPQADRAKSSEAGSNAGKPLSGFTEPSKQNMQRQMSRRGRCMVNGAPCSQVLHRWCIFSVRRIIGFEFQMLGKG